MSTAKLSASVDEILAALQLLGSPENVAGMARFGIQSKVVFGVPMPKIKELAKRLGRQQELAQELWATGVHDARILAAFVAEPKLVTVATLQHWASQMDNWAVCDNLCNHLVRKTPHAWALVDVWCDQEPEFVRRAGFSLLAVLAVHDKKAPDTVWPKWLQTCEAYGSDERNFVKKAVCWAMRQIGKRNAACRKLAMATAKRLAKQPSKAARWTAKATLRELEARSTPVRRPYFLSDAIS